MLIILGNAYQGVITSTLIQQEDEYTFKSFEDLLEKGYAVNIGSNHMFKFLLENNSLYRTAEAKGQVFEIEGITLLDAYENNTALVLPCETANFYMAKTNFIDYFYSINQKMFPQFVQLEASFANPFIRTWQKIVNRCFEAGLLDYWRKKWMSDIRSQKDLSEYSNGILSFEDISNALYRISFLYFLAIFVFLCEILYKKYIEPIRMKKNVHPSGEELTPRNNRLEVIFEEEEEQDDDDELEEVM